MSNPSDEAPATDHWLGVVRDKVAAIRFGSVQITVHDGRVTQVEAIEKTRISSDRIEAAQETVKPKKKS